MTYHDEVAREYLREAFHKGTLDITASFEDVRGFVHIFAGEMDALIAINNCAFLSREEVEALMKVAAPTKRTVRQFQIWRERAISGSA